LFLSEHKSNDVARFAIDTRGRLTRLGNVATMGPPADVVLSLNSQYLYVLDVLNANGSNGALIDTYSIGSDGGTCASARQTPASRTARRG
jgi:hypothetical protein